jgi:Tfp pilus assembly protein PilF
LALSVKSPADTRKPDSRPTKATTPERPPSVNSQLENARHYLDQGQYNEALKELSQANRIAPGNKEVQAAIADAKRACSAEKRLGRTDLKC